MTLRPLGAIASIFAATCTTAPPLPGLKPVAFVSCPILRDTASVGCWLTSYGGELYYLGISVDQSAPFDPPSLGHRALVEGVVTNTARVCGGIPIDPVHVSVLDIDPSCNQLLPADPRFELGFTPPRGPGPKEKRQPARESAIPGPPRPAGEDSFVVHYDFNRERAGLDTGVMIDALRRADEIGATRISIHAYRAAVRLTDGTALVENEWIAERRAKTLAETMIAIGARSEIVDVTWTSQVVAAKGNGLDAGNRRAVITLSR